MKWKKSSLTISLFHFDYLHDEAAKKIDAINKDGDDKIRKNEFDFSSFRIKIRLYDNFYENFRRKSLTHFLRHFQLI